MDYEYVDYAELDRQIRKMEQLVRKLLLRASVEASSSSIEECLDATDELRGLHAMRIGDLGDQPLLPTY